jgi:orotate phosphoribosyltransferase
MRDPIDGVPARRGHFRLESGHHGELWLDLERLCLSPRPIQHAAARLAQRLAPHAAQVVCGPLVEGAFLALLVAAELDLPFTYSERLAAPQPRALYPWRYGIPRALRGELAGRRIAIVSDVINGGSALRGTLQDLRACEARPVAVGALLALGPQAARIAAEHELRLEALESRPHSIWRPAECPLCARGVPLCDLLDPGPGEPGA